MCIVTLTVSDNKQLDDIWAWLADKSIKLRAPFYKSWHESRREYVVDFDFMSKENAREFMSAWHGRVSYRDDRL